MKQLKWWSPDSPGTLLSRKWIQTFVFELPDLSQAELKSSLRYKVQATLPVNTEQFEFHTQLLRHGKKKYGAAFLAPPTIATSLPRPTRTFRVGVPLTLPPAMSPQTLLFISTPDGLSPHLYEKRILKTSFAPLDTRDLVLRRRLIDQFPDAAVVGFSPDPEIPLPLDLRQKQPAPAIQARLLNAFPLWDPPVPSRLPIVLGCLLTAAGILLLGLALVNTWSVKEQRNEAWRNWLKQNEAQSITLANQDRRPLWLKAQGAPVPELFLHLAAVWNDETKILDLEWSQGKLTLTAEGPSALASLRKLTADPWFKSLKVDDIRTQKNGLESFTVEGGLSLDR